MERAADPRASYGLPFPEAGDVAVLLLQEKTVFGSCNYNNQNGLNGLAHGVLL